MMAEHHYDVACVNCGQKRGHGSFNEILRGHRIKGPKCDGCSASDTYKRL